MLDVIIKWNVFLGFLKSNDFYIRLIEVLTTSCHLAESTIVSSADELRASTKILTSTSMNNMDAAKYFKKIIQFTPFVNSIVFQPIQAIFALTKNTRTQLSDMWMHSTARKQKKNAKSYATMQHLITAVVIA